MLETLAERKINFRWITSPPAILKKFAVVIPQYNEAKVNASFKNRLHYFHNLGIRYKDWVDVILVDDGSSDQSLALIKDFQLEIQGAFHIAAISPNGNKVGAIYLTICEIEHPYVILTDFDTDIEGLEYLSEYIEAFLLDDKLIGGFFRMLPFEGRGGVFSYQQLEYSIARGLYAYHQLDKSVPVMPGAGAIFATEILQEIYQNHSGLRSGEDRETTLIGMKLGYKCVYLDKLLALTRPPLSYNELIRQRVRWNLGYIETFKKERLFYFLLLKSLSPVGVRFFLDFLWVSIICSLPVILIAVSIYNLIDALILIPILYGVCVVWCSISILCNVNETKEIRNKLISSVLIFPIYKFSVDYLAWSRAIHKYFKEYISRK